MDKDYSLYNELKPEISRLVNPLFDLSITSLKKRNGFLPHAAVITDEGEVRLLSALPIQPNDKSTSINVLPLLYAGLRKEVQENSITAIGVAEDVTVTLEGIRPSGAIKVLLEHRRGLVIALYLPYEKKFLRGFVMGSSFALPAEPEVNAFVNIGI